MLPSLSQELVDIIIDFLHNDPIALRNCALVCKGWLPSCRLHIFGKLVLQFSHDADDLRRSLLISPDLIRCIQRLAIAYQHPVVFANRLGIELSSLRSLELREVSPFDIPDNQAEFNASLFVFATITELELSHCRFADFSQLRALLLAFPCLASVSLMGGFNWDVFRDCDTERKNHGLHLRHLRIPGLNAGLTQQFLGWFLRGTSSPDQLTQLSTLHTSGGCDADDLLRATGDALQHFTCYLVPSGIAPDLTLNTRLISLSVQSWNMFSSNRSLRLMFSQLRSPVLERIKVTVATTTTAHQEGLDLIGWEALSDMRFRRPDLGRLEQITIVLMIWEAFRGFHGDPRTLVEAAAAEVRSREAQSQAAILRRVPLTIIAITNQGRQEYTVVD